MTPGALDPATVHEKLRLLEELLDVLTLVDGVPVERLRDDAITRLAVERVLTQAVDLVTSVCSHVASAQGRRTATTYRGAIEDAASLGLIDPYLARSLGSAVGLRNVLVHEYVRVDLTLVAAAVPIAARDLTAFVQQVAGWLAGRP